MTEAAQSAPAPAERMFAADEASQRLGIELLEQGEGTAMLEIIHDLAPGGGYIASPSHNVQADVPPANLIAMRDAVEEFGYYPIGG